MSRKRHKIDRYEALGCMGCIIITAAILALIGFIATCILFINNIKVVCNV